MSAGHSSISIIISAREMLTAQALCLCLRLCACHGVCHCVRAAIGGLTPIARNKRPVSDGPQATHDGGQPAVSHRQAYDSYEGFQALMTTDDSESCQSFVSPHG
jgi:hypothetical protein